MIVPGNAGDLRSSALVLLVCVALGSTATPTAARATPAASSDLERALSSLAAAVEREQNLSPEFKRALSGVIDALREQRTVETAAAPAPGHEPKTRGFWERLRPFGDIRVRYEYTSVRPDLEDRHRARLRLRVGAEYDLTSELTAGFRIRTGNPDDPNSPYQTLNSMFDSWEFNLDRAYVRYRPEWLEGAWAVAGKYELPFQMNPVYGELVWDFDVHPEGGTLGYSREVAEGHTLRAAPGLYVLQEQGSGTDSTLFALQGSASSRWSDDWSTRVAVGWYRYFDVTPDRSIFAIRDNAGNNLIDVVVDGEGNIVSADFASKFSIIHPIVSLTYDEWTWPVTLAGEVFVNTEAATSQDTGFAVGLSLGRLAETRDWQAFYQYQRVEREAVFSAFAQDDFTLATNFKGHVFGASYAIAKGVSLRAWSLLAKPIEIDPTFPAFSTNDDQIRVRLDLSARF